MRTTWSVLAPKLNQDTRWVQNSIADPRDGGRGKGVVADIHSKILDVPPSSFLLSSIHFHALMANFVQK